MASIWWVLLKTDIQDWFTEKPVEEVISEGGAETSELNGGRENIYVLVRR